MILNNIILDYMNNLETHSNYSLKMCPKENY